MTIWLYWAGIALYSITVLWVGWRGYKRTEVQNTSEFWAAGRSLNAWSVGLSISASFMSISWSCVYAVQLVYWYGISSVWLLAIPWLLVMAIFWFLTPTFRRLPAFSQPEMVAQRFGQDVRKYLAVPLAFVFLVWGGAEIYAAAKILTPILKLPFHVILAFIALVVAVYSYMGGFGAVVSTDKIQFALVAFFITSIAYVAGNAVTTDATLWQVASSLSSPPMTQKPALQLWAAGPALVLITLVAYLPGWVIETDIWLRLQAARSDRFARRGLLIASVNSLLFIGIFPLVIGLSALYLYPPAGAEIPAILNDGAAIFSVFINQHAPPTLALLLIVGLAAASMSTIDTCGNVVALSLSYDLLEPYLKRTKRGFSRQKVARWTSAGAVFMAYVYALFTTSLWDIFYLSSGILTTTIFLPMLALLSRTCQPGQIKAATTVGFIATIGFYFVEKSGLMKTLQPHWLSETGLGYIVWALLVSVLAYWLARKRRTIEGN